MGVIREMRFTMIPLKILKCRRSEYFSSVTIFKRLSRKEDKGEDEDGDATDEQKDDRTNSESGQILRALEPLHQVGPKRLNQFALRNAMNSTRERTSPSLSDSPVLSQSSERDGSVSETELANPLSESTKHGRFWRHVGGL